MSDLKKILSSLTEGIGQMPLKFPIGTHKFPSKYQNYFRNRYFFYQNVITSSKISRFLLKLQHFLWNSIFQTELRNCKIPTKASELLSETNNSLKSQHSYLNCKILLKNQNYLLLLKFQNSHQNLRNLTGIQWLPLGVQNSRRNFWLPHNPSQPAFSPKNYNTRQKNAFSSF